MSRYYYPNNEILTPRWVTPKTGGFQWWWLILPLLLLAALGAGAFWLFMLGPERNARRATVLILVDRNGDKQPDSQGSGFFISPRGYVLTNRHVVMSERGEKPARIEVWYLAGTKDRQVMEATLERTGEGQIGGTPENIRNDWAVLHVASKEQLPYLQLASKVNFAEEEKLRALGYPRAQETATNEFGASVKIVPGSINRVDRSAQGGVVRLTHNASTAEGMSGGPVVQDGNLIGINTQVLGGGKVTANENYALPAFLLREPVFNVYSKK